MRSVLFYKYKFYIWFLIPLLIWNYPNFVYAFPPTFGFKQIADNTTTFKQRDDANAIINKLHEYLIEAMKKGKEETFEQRREKLDPVVRSTFDLDHMAQVSVGHYWGEMSNENQKHLLDSFAKMSVAIYASRFKKYKDQKFEILEQQAGPEEGTFWVVSQLTFSNPNKDPVFLNYLMRDNTNGLKVIDVFLGGAISEMATKRAEYTSVIRTKGVDNFLKALDQRIDDIAQGKDINDNKD
ncbi:MAG: ABC transporter substrate-binding protein [Alphaproteobacteria bacterium]|nr:ABC transporter substrate-binding protein [Alphaproteobacteria bacterium]